MEGQTFSRKLKKGNELCQKFKKQQKLVYFAKKKKIKETQIGKLHESMKEKEKKEILGR